MSQILSPLALKKAREQVKNLQIIVEIEGVTNLFAAQTILTRIKIGDTDLLIDGSWLIGGLLPYENQSTDPLISVEGTSSTINQQLDPDRAIGTSVSFLDIALIDVNEQITNLISPSFVIDDILGKRAKVYLGFNDTSFPEDYIVIFRSIIVSTKSDPGLVTLSLSNPEEKKRQTIFKKQETNLSGGIGTGTGTINVDDTTGFLAPVLGPDGLVDSDLNFYVQIDNELLQYNSLTGTSFNVTARGALGTIAASHADNAQVNSFYELKGNCMDIALKFMLSGKEGPYEEDVEVTNFGKLADGTLVPNSIFFKGKQLNKQHGVSVGDYITTTLATNAANNVTLKKILSILSSSEGDYIVIDGVSFVEEVNTNAIIDFRSAYDVWPTGAGLSMHGDEVDTISHEQLRDLFLSSVSYQFFLRDDIKGKDFIDKELYSPAGVYMIPRGSRASAQFHAPPIPGSNIQTFDATNIYNFDKLAINRSINRNFYNTIIYKYNDTALDSEFTKNLVTISTTSINRIALGNKPLTIESAGLKTDLNGDTSAQLISNRRLKRYEYGAEWIPQVKVFLEQGMQSEIGDVILLDGASLKITDITNGTRDFVPRLLEITNKSLNIQTGETSITLTDTSFDEQARYCLMSGSSNIKNGISSTQFVIKESFSGAFYANEFLKWTNKIGAGILVRNESGSISGAGMLLAVNGNTITTTDLGFTPTSNMIMELSAYNNQPIDIILVYGYMTDESAFDDGRTQYNMI